jgi:hypothetical protein
MQIGEILKEALDSTRLLLHESILENDLNSILDGISIVYFDWALLNENEINIWIAFFLIFHLSVLKAASIFLMTISM